MLDTIYDGTAPARLVVIHDSLAAPAAPLANELIARAEKRGQPTLTIALMRPAPPGSLDLSAAVKGYSDVDVEKTIKEACSALDPTTQMYIDAADILAEDIGTAAAYRILRQILKQVQAPGRLILTLPSSPFATDILSSTLSPSVALLTPHHPRAVECISRSLLIPIDEDRFWHQLPTTSGDSLALAGSEGVDINPSDSYVVQFLLRKATGGAKGMLRGLKGIKKTRGGDWEIAPLGEVTSLRPLANTKTTTHADLALPFNLSLTDRQRAERGSVPLPYAHEGEGADLRMGMDWSDDEEDDEI